MQSPGYWFEPWSGKRRLLRSYSGQVAMSRNALATTSADTGRSCGDFANKRSINSDNATGTVITSVDLLHFQVAAKLASG